MNIETTNDDGVIILAVSGKMIVGAGDDSLLKTVERHAAAGHTEMILDLGGVTYVDSAGLGEIVQCRALLTEKKGKLKLRNVPKQVYDRLSITRLVSLFENDEES